MKKYFTHDVNFYNFHPPDDVREYVTPLKSIKYWDLSVLVLDLCIDNNILRKYAFADRWFEVNCSFTKDGKLLEEHGVIDWAFNCDICTPILIDNHNIYNVDLSFDVFVSSDGATYAVTDEDDF